MPKKKKQEQTSEEIASIAARLLRDPKTPKDVRRVAASVLTQAPDKKKPKKKPPAKKPKPKKKS